MATINLGFLSDYDYDQGTTTAVEIPDGGPLPELPPGTAEAFDLEAVSPVRPTWGPPTAGTTVSVVTVTNPKPYWRGRSVWLLFAPARQEWVCLDVEHYVHDGSWTGDFSFVGPYKAPDHLLQKVLEAFHTPTGAVSLAEVRRTPPDQLAAFGQPG
jgi:hypothetical protein